MLFFKKLINNHFLIGQTLNIIFLIGQNADIRFILRIYILCLHMRYMLLLCRWRMWILLQVKLRYRLFLNEWINKKTTFVFQLLLANKSKKVIRTHAHMNAHIHICVYLDIDLMTEMNTSVYRLTYRKDLEI